MASISLLKVSVDDMREWARSAAGKKMNLSCKI